MSENAKWYVIHTYSGYENAVKTSIEKFVNGRGMEDMILRMEIPVETVKEVSEPLTRGALSLFSLLFFVRFFRKLGPTPTANSASCPTA